VHDSNGLQADSLRDYSLLWPALCNTAERYAIPHELLFGIIDGVEMDLGPVRIADWDELTEYSYYVASTVGLACTRLWGAKVTLPRQSAIDCGIAFQITNILRDLREDAARGRIYVPATQLQRFGCSAANWLRCQPDVDWFGCVDAMIARARQLYDNGWRTSEHLNDEGQRMFSLMWRTYRELLDEIDRSKASLWSGSPIRVSRWKKMKLAISHFLPNLYRRLPEPIVGGYVEFEHSSAT
jgi:phytoene synthase